MLSISSTVSAVNTKTAFVPLTDTSILAEDAHQKNAHRKTREIESN